IEGRPRGGGSTWQSVVRGTGSVETDYLTGEIVLRGRLIGAPTPVNELLQALARETVRDRHEPGWITAEHALARL
ncbi:MAG TPA: ketopantoate reductase C-terminal domain-containing protein, partial [Solirubrobacteraceae bacterium]|nr:ketopantoate reductase C-terminal domain-containing protein [Solirubrobacteraceae bacterium]